jgi:hypothetical protein
MALSWQDAFFHRRLRCKGRVVAVISIEAALAAGLGLVGTAALAWLRPRLSGTTLVAVWAWSLVALAMVVASQVGLGLARPASDTIAAVRFASAMSTFCPLMALLGAKRPQDRAWQWIVLSLWVILSLPGFEWLLFGGPTEIHAARAWFLSILVGIGVSNGLATRQWLGSVLYGGGQAALLAPFLVETRLSGEASGLLGLGLLSASWLLLALDWPRRGAAGPLDRVWLDFRDSFGVVWGLRVAERVNATARLADWPLHLSWRGFRPRDPGQPLEIPPAAVDSLRTLLRRFVSRDWVDARLAELPETSRDDAPTAAAR